MIYACHPSERRNPKPPQPNPTAQTPQSVKQTPYLLYHLQAALPFPFLSLLSPSLSFVVATFFPSSAARVLLLLRLRSLRAGAGPLLALAPAPAPRVFLSFFF